MFAFLVDCGCEWVIVFVNGLFTRFVGLFAMGLSGWIHTTTLFLNELWNELLQSTQDVILFIRETGTQNVVDKQTGKTDPWKFGKYPTKKVIKYTTTSQASASHSKYRFLT